MKMKLNVLLAKTEHSTAQFKKLISDYIAFFKNNQGDFRGAKKTYTPLPNKPDFPNERGVMKVVTTVTEKLQWLEETAAEHIDNLFAVEATNANGNAKAELIVEEKSFGIFSSLELLRLKSLIENADFEKMYATLPVRSDSEIWVETAEEAYRGRDIYQKPQMSGQNKTTIKESYIIPDPNVQHLKDSSKYVAQVATKDTIDILGDYTFDFYSGETTHRNRAEILRRRSALLAGIIEALKKANEAEAIESQMTAKKLFNYLHRGTI